MRNSFCRVWWGRRLWSSDLLLFVWLAVFPAIDLQASGGLEHFYWSAVPSSVQAEKPFFVTLRARSLGNASYTNFNGAVRVTELIPAADPNLLITEIQIINTNRVELSNVSPAPVDVSGWRVVFYDSASWPAPKMTFTIPSGTVCPGHGVFEVRGAAGFPGTYPIFNAGVTLTWPNAYSLAWSSSPNSTIAVLLLDAQGQQVDFFCAGGAFPAYIAVPTFIPDTLWSGPPVVTPTGIVDPNLTYQRAGHSDRNNAADWVTATNTFSVLNPMLQFPFIGLASQFAVVPASVTLSNGKWSGLLAVSVSGTNVFLRADDGDGLPGDSAPFAVVSLPSLQVRVPSEAYKATAGLVGQGEVSIPQSLSSNVDLTLSSSLTNEIVVPMRVTIVAGATNALFTVSNLDGGLLEGPQVATIVAAAPGFTPGMDWITNYDRPTASVFVTAPARVPESAGWVTTAQVSSGAPVAADVVVRVTSTNPNKLLVPDSVIIPAGQSAARLGMAAIQNPFLDGDQFVTIAVSVPGWTAGQAQVLVYDNRATNLSLMLPWTSIEGAGVLTNAGTVFIPGFLTTNLVVTLSNELPAKLQLPPSVIIPAGQTSAVFNVVVPDDLLADGDKTLYVTASADGFRAAFRPMRITDNDISTFSFGSLPAAQMAGQSFPVTVYAWNASGTLVPGYSNSVSLRAQWAAGNVAVVPTTIGPFTNGVWSGLVSVSSASLTTQLSVDDGLGHSGVSSAFDVVAGRIWSMPVSDFAYDPLRKKIQAALLGTAVTNGQSVVAIDPASGALGSPVALGANPGKVALSGDGQFLYVGLTVTGGVARVDLNPGTVGLRFATGQSGGSPIEMGVPPGNPHALIAWMPWGQGMALFRDGVQSPSVVGPDPCCLESYSLFFYDSPTNFYTASPGGLRTLNITPSGPTLVRAVEGYNSAYTYEGGLVFNSSGDVYDPVNMRHLGAYPAMGWVAANANVGQVYFVSGNTLLVYDMTTFAPVGAINLPITAGAATKLVSCGTNGLAVATASQLMVVQSDLIPSTAQADLSVTQMASSDTAIAGSNFTYSITVSNAGPEMAPEVILADVLPADAVFVSATNSQAVCTVMNGILRCDFGPLAPGTSLTTTLILQPSTPGNLVNLAWAIGDGINLTNGTSRRTNTVVFGSVLPAVTQLGINAGSLAYDSMRNAMWFSTERFGGALENNLRSINLSNGLPQNVLVVGSAIGKIALSANQNYLYAAYSGNTYVRRANLLTGVVDLTFPVLDGANQAQGVLDMIGVASYPADILVAGAGANNDVSLYQNGAAVRRTPNYVGAGKLEINPAIPTRVYALVGNLARLDIGSSAINILGSMNFSGRDLRYGQGLLFSDSGLVVDPEAMTIRTILPVAGLVQTDPASGLVFYLVQNGAQCLLTAFDMTTLSQAGSCIVPGVIGKAANLTRCGPGILAFKTDYDQLFILNTAHVPFVLQSELVLSETASDSSLMTNVPVTFTTLISNAGPSAATGVIIANLLPPDAVVLGITASQGAATNIGNTITADLGDVQVGFLASLQVVATLSHAGILTNAASVSQANPELILTNNIAAATVQFSIMPASDMSISQAAAAAPFFVGSNLVYSIVVSNEGPDTATGVEFADTTIAAATFVSVTVSQGSVTFGSGTLDALLGIISNGCAATVNIVLSPTSGGLFLNSAVVSSQNSDPNPGNNYLALNAISILNTNGQNLVQEVPLHVLDMAYDASNQVLVASTAATPGTYASSVVGISAATGSLLYQVPIGNSLGRVAVSDDGRYAYVAIMDIGGVARVDIPSRTVNLRFAINAPAAEFGPFTVEDMAVMPGAPDSLAVARAGYSGYSSGVALFDSGVQRPVTLTNANQGASYFKIAFASPTNLYTTAPYGFQAATIDPTGLTIAGPLFSAYTGNFALGGGRVFLANGSVFDPISGSLTGTFPTSGLVVPDLADDRVYFFNGGNVGGVYNVVIHAFDPLTHGELWAIRFPTSIGAEQRLVSLGTNGLAFLTDSGILCLVRPAQMAQPNVDLSISGAASRTSVTAGDSLSFTYTVRNYGPWTASGVVVSNPIPAGVSNVSASSSQGACVFTNGALVSYLGSMVNGATATITLNTTAASVGSLTNVAWVSANEFDSSPANDASTNVVTVNPQPSLRVVDAVATQGTSLSTITFVLSLSAPSTATVSVGYQTADGTAIAGRDYDAASGIVTFSPGITSRQLSLSIIRSNTSPVPECVFLLNLANATNATLARTQAVATIVHRTFYGVSIAGATVETKGGLTNAAFRVTLSPPSTVPVSLLYQTVDGSALAGADYAPRAGTLIFAPGVTNLTVNVPVLAVSTSGTTRTFSVVLSQPQNAILTVNEAQAFIVENALVGPLIISGVQLQGTNVWIQFDTIKGRYYRLERSDDLGSGSWVSVADPIPGTGNSFVLSDALEPAAQTRFYRLVLKP